MFLEAKTLELADGSYQDEESQIVEESRQSQLHRSWLRKGFFMLLIPVATLFGQIIVGSALNAIGESDCTAGSGSRRLHTPSGAKHHTPNVLSGCGCGAVVGGATGSGTGMAWGGSHGAYIGGVGGSLFGCISGALSGVNQDPQEIVEIFGTSLPKSCLVGASSGSLGLSIGKC